MGKLRVLSLFSGIGAFEEALNNIGIDWELINYCEFQPYIGEAYALIHNTNSALNLGDITKVDETKLKDFDLMTFGFPCQDISGLGNQVGFFDSDGKVTRSGLFFEAIRIAKYKKPPYMIIENVRALISKPMQKNFQAMLNLLDELNYNVYYKVLNSKDYAIPHSRNRIFLVCIRKDVDKKGFNFPEPQPLTTKASDYYSHNVDDTYYLKEDQYKYFNDFRLKKKYSSINADVLICMTTKQGQKSNPQNFIHDEKGYRIMTEEEMFALQGFKREYGPLLKAHGYTTRQVGYMLGNSITVTVLECIFKELFS